MYALRHAKLSDRANWFWSKIVESGIRRTALALALAAISALPVEAAAVGVWEGTIELPTYALGEEDPNPPFALMTGHSIYPYTMLDDLTDRLEMKTYRALFLENEFLKATVLPQIGGRLYSLYDKMTGREVFYRNNVVKYGLVALRGAWISGGIEFNFPDGHTMVTVSPVSWSTRQSGDGSATVSVGDIDQVTGMHWEVALTLRPGQARLEQQVTLFNPTPMTNPYWYWANAAVPATDYMHFVYPMREAYPHARWPVHTYPEYEGADYSWYKNVRKPTSLFGRQVHRNFFGAYYQFADYGVVHVADFREVPGKKIWTWGVAGDGLIWTDLLTDHDGPYNEIQSGRYETQLNYEFMPPRKVESWTEYWYPVRGLGGSFVEATSDLALNARFVPQAGIGEAPFEIAISPTVEIHNLKVRLKSGSRMVREFGPVSLQPLTPLTFEVPVKDLQTGPKLALDANLSIEVESSGGQVLARWSSADPIDGNRDFVPAAGAPEPQAKPIEKMTVEEVFLRGVEQEKGGDEHAARETYARVLERDPGYIPALLKEAWWHYRAADFQGAEALIARAMSRNSFDPAVHYAAGVIYRASGRWTLTVDALWAAVHYGGPAAPALAQLGEIAIHRKDYDEAEKLLRTSLSYNPSDELARTDLAVALRLAGKLRQASITIDEVVEKMPIFPFALAERWRNMESGGPDSGASDYEKTMVRNWDESLAKTADTYLDVAAWYRGLGDLDSSDAVLSGGIAGLKGQALSPLIVYYQESNARLEGVPSKAERLAGVAGSTTYVKVFPHRLEDAVVLADAALHSPLDSHAPYFLGNFLFARGRYEDASKLWLQALGEGFDHSVLERNLGACAWRVQKDLNGAASYYAKAVQLAPDDYRLYRDLDEIYFQMGDTARRAKLFAAAPATVLERDVIRARRALLLVQQRQFDEALELFARHRFKPWEGGGIVREIFVFANIAKGRQYLEAHKFEQAERAFRQALEYPPNLGVGKPDRPHNEEPLYWLGEALGADGKNEEARAAWQQATEAGNGQQGHSRLFAALALGRLGKTADAEKTLSALTQAASDERADAYTCYVAGLAERARNHAEMAEKAFRRALALEPSLWQARIELKRSGGGI